MTEEDRQFMLRAIELAQEGIDRNLGGPFGCVIAKGGRLIGEGCNQVTSTNDPTAHAEIIAIRDACRSLGTFQLDGCVIYTSCEPCPMCLGAIYWARPAALFIAADREDAARIGFDDEMIYEELGKSNYERQLTMVRLLRDEALKVFQNWAEKPDKTEY